jgi:shikimate dehydrogenase
MHNAAFKALGIDGVYACLPIKEGKLKETIMGLRALGFRGVNITVPYKERVLEYLGDIVEDAKNVRAVNTILVEKDRMVGHNTDTYGFENSLAEYEISIEDKRLLLLGAGGAAHSCVYVINSMKPRRLIITDKILNRAKTLSCLYDAEVTEPQKIEDIIPGMDIVVNATPVDFQKMVLSKMKKGAVYYDLNYKFKIHQKGGVKVINGLLMLVYQGARSFSLWTKKEAPISVMKRTVGLKND